MMQSTGQQPSAGQSHVLVQAGRTLAAIALFAAGTFQVAAIAAPVTASPHEPGPASPMLAQPGAIPGPPEIQTQNAHNGVITPPSGISRMPVIQPRMPSNTPVIPPAGTPGGNQSVIPK